MNYNKAIRQKTSGVIRHSCSLLFVLFIFCYIYFIQGEVLAEAQYVFSKGLTRYSLLPGALILTGVAKVIQWLVTLFVTPPQRFHALTYVPSFVFIISILWTAMLPVEANDMIPLKLSLLMLVVGAIVVLILFYFIGKLKEDKSYEDIAWGLWQNAMILMLMMVFTGAVTCTTDTTYYELQTERHILMGEYEKATDVARKSLKVTRRHTNLRMYALSKQGMLAECIFDYPQDFGGEGLLSLADTSSMFRFGSKKIEQRLGAFAGDNIKSPLRYLEIVNGNDTLRTSTTMDYHLCYLLLERNLTEFSRLLSVYGYDSVPLPKAYREAVTLIENDSTDERYMNYLSQKAEITDPLQRANFARRYFGDTYWYYYEKNKL